MYSTKMNSPASGLEEIQNIQKSLLQIGIKMGFQVKGEQPIHWSDENGQQVYSFYFTPWANISDLLLYPVDSRVGSGRNQSAGPTGE